MANTENRPVFLLIHGAWHTPAFYAPFCKTLEAQGYEAVCPYLPTCNGDVPPTKCLVDDVSLIRETVLSLIAAGKSIVAIMHSYGGIVGTEALHSLGVKEQAQASKKGSVKHLVYVSAFVPTKGKSFLDLSGGNCPEWIDSRPEENLLLVPDPAAVLYNDLPADEAASWAAQLLPFPRSAQIAPISQIAYSNIPATFVVCENDAAVPPWVQKLMLKGPAEEGIEFAVESIQSSHSPFLSMPDKLAKLVIKIGSK
ncbi:hypothetical protein AJ80_00752 [Polytolypa hystricis UAMH7299]|uniref:AB hydrolase-1 domain-containing protein n=1 Tax=Polytolypa hystricis (strain UAMH7299) TaxID=1447883 RepID=A0A2B7Z2E1_POLH7|nr:hypothetical protein AJ80_00752 [Polytolypa hystricis UAMH7299]